MAITERLRLRKSNTTGGGKYTGKGYDKDDKESDDDNSDSSANDRE